jgi:hypothetical protein
MKKQLTVVKDLLVSSSGSRYVSPPGLVRKQDSANRATQCPNLYASQHYGDTARTKRS